MRLCRSDAGVSSQQTTLVLDGSIPDDEILEMVDHSYEQVVKGLTRVEREKLKAMGG